MTEEEITRMVARGMYLVYCQQRGYRPHREGYVPVRSCVPAPRYGGDLVMVYVATTDTGSFNFMAVGDSPDAAREAMRRGLAAHAVAVGLDASWVDLVMWDAVNVTDVPMGGCARDWSVITGGGE